jgi:hypothetical protein
MLMNVAVIVAGLMGQLPDSLEFPILPGHTAAELLRLSDTRILAPGVVAKLKQFDTIIVDE